MRTTGTKNVFAVILAGMLMATASPTLAHAQSSRGADPTPLTMPELKAAIAAAEPLRIQNYNSGLVLAPSGGSTANGAKIIQATSSSTSTTQRWLPVQDNGFVSYQNIGSGKNLGIDGGSTSAGAAAIQANPAGDLNQDWDVYIVSGTHYALKNRKSGMCLGISGASQAVNASAAQFSCDSKANQSWIITRW
ncbi:RICIN domain-containing protein [Streptomyces sp. NPDC093085]|uniref:RICIN domain-containing protein n=1 Tax=Streptomyces sp. NPDC093085 TaxID=3155068 RepID=UPI003424B48A